MAVLVLCVCFSFQPISAADKSVNKSVLQPVPDQFFLESSGWLDNWKRTQLSQFKTLANRVVLLMVIQSDGKWETLGLVRTDPGGSELLEGRKIEPLKAMDVIRTAPTGKDPQDLSMSSVSLENALPLVHDAWRMITSARFGAQSDNVTVDANEVWYLLCREPNENSVFSYYTAEIAQAINPPPESEVQNLRRRLLALFHNKRSQQSSAKPKR